MLLTPPCGHTTSASAVQSLKNLSGIAPSEAAERSTFFSLEQPLNRPVAEVASTEAGTVYSVSPVPANALAPSEESLGRLISLSDEQPLNVEPGTSATLGKLTLFSDEQP